MNRQRLTFTAFLLICVYGLWYLQDQLTPERLNVTPYNEAVTYTYEDDEQTLAVTRHEAAHVMLNGMLAAGPLWLHEGMAEYFELLSMRQQYSQIAPNTDWLNLARLSVAGGYPVSLADFLEAPPEEW